METEHAKENGGTQEQKTLSTPSAAGTQAGRLPLPHNPATEETSQRPETPGVLQLRGRKLPCAGRWRHLRLSADDVVLRLLLGVPLGGRAAGQDAGCGDLPGQGLESLFGVRRCVRPEVQPGQILPGLRSFSVCCKWFRWAVLPLDRTLEAEIYRDRDLKRCAECGGVFVPKSNRV